MSPRRRTSPRKASPKGIRGKGRSVTRKRGRGIRSSGGKLRAGFSMFGYDVGAALSSAKDAVSGAVSNTARSVTGTTRSLAKTWVPDSLISHVITETPEEVTQRQTREVARAVREEEAARKEERRSAKTRGRRQLSDLERTVNDHSRIAAAWGAFVKRHGSRADGPDTVDRWAHQSWLEHKAAAEKGEADLTLLREAAKQESDDVATAKQTRKGMGAVSCRALLDRYGLKSSSEVKRWMVAHSPERDPDAADDFMNVRDCRSKVALSGGRVKGKGTHHKPKSPKKRSPSPKRKIKRRSLSRSKSRR